jgi:transposase
MSKQARKPCPRCRQLQGRVDALQAEVNALRAQLLALQEQLAAAKKDSSTSSKPPSSDIVKPPPAGGDAAGERKIGGQPGHPKHERALFPEEQVTHFENHLLDACPCCGGVLRRNGNLIQVVQQVDIEKVPWSVEQHSFPEYWCASCQKGYKAPLPLHIEKGGLVGPRLTALIAYMKGVCHASFSTVRKYLRDIVGVTISRGQLSKIVGKVTWALEKPYEELLALLPGTRTMANHGGPGVFAPSSSRCTTLMPTATPKC